MSSTTAPPAVEIAVDPFGLDEAATLAFVVDRRRRQDLAAAEELRGVTQWADLHRVTDDRVGSLDPDLAEPFGFLEVGGDRLLGPGR